MSIVDHHGEVEYPFSQKTVFRAIMEAAPNINGLSLDSADEISGRMTFKAGVSLASWGENIPVQLIKVAPTRTQVKIMSTPKTGVMFGGVMDFGKNQQNIDKIINAVSAVLANYPPEVEPEKKVDVAEQLTKLKQLTDQGILTEEEFSEQKKKILDGTNQIVGASSVSSGAVNKAKQDDTPIRIEGSGEGSSTNYALIALVVFVVVFLLLMMASCNSQTENSTQIAEIEKMYQDSLSAVRKELKEAKLKIEVLSYPADQRFSHITELFNAQEYEKAKKEIAELKNVFPNASENTECAKMLEKISAIEAAKKAEEERIKALGFKAIPQKTSIKIGYNTITLSSISIGKTFTFDYRSDEWTYREADRGTKYISAAMAVTSSDHDPNLPQFAVYKIEGGEMIYEESFDTEFARWEDYGTYLGNYHDSRNDFAKVSTVKFKIGAQISDGVLSKPYAIVVKNENGLTSSYDRYRNPPKSYIGSVSYPRTLCVEDFAKNYTLVKTYNLK